MNGAQEYTPPPRYTDYAGLMMSRRLFAVGVILSLLLVPALTRAGQPLDAGRRPTATSSFTKSFDFPPDLVVVAPDLTFIPLDTEQLRHPVARDVAGHPETLPNAPDLLDADSLRGPPPARSVRR
jgi:hypothetical protein